MASWIPVSPTYCQRFWLLWMTRRQPWNAKVRRKDCMPGRTSTCLAAGKASMLSSSHVTRSLWRSKCHQAQACTLLRASDVGGWLPAWTWFQCDGSEVHSDIHMYLLFPAALAALQHIAESASARDLHWSRELLADTAKRVVTGADERVWPAAAPAACALMIAIEGVPSPLCM